MFLFIRYLHIDFSHTVTTRGFSAVFRQPQMGEDIYGGQFGLEVWIGVGLILMLLILSMILILKFENNDEQKFGMYESVSWLGGET